MLSETGCEYTTLTPQHLQAMLQSAIANLEKFSYVGITEYWRDSVSLLQDTLLELGQEDVQDTLLDLGQEGAEYGGQNEASGGPYEATGGQYEASGGPYEASGGQYNVAKEMIEKIRKANEGDVKLYYHALR